jgi:ABC-2 type transport system ATP-binding protein
METIEIMENAIEVKDLTKDYGSFLLDHVSFTLPGGTVMGLIGENGAGKSTLIKCMLGLIRRDGGSIRLLGEDNLAGGSALREELGVVLDESTFHDGLKAPQVDKILSNIYRKWDSALFESYLERFNLPRDKTFREYSRGRKMKLCIAAALSHRPRLLILDEATSGLDPVVRSEILDEFLNFIQDEEHAVLISSHITSDLEKVSDFVTYLHEGRVTLTGAKDELLEEHGRLACTRSDLDRVAADFVVSTRISQFSCEALIRNKREFRARYPGLTVDPVSLEDLMLFTARGEKR